jgi:hypothetical protein
MSADFRDLIFETAKATVAASRTAYEAGFEAGYTAGMQRAVEIINASGKPADAATVKDGVNV